MGGDRANDEAAELAAVAARYARREAAVGADRYSTARPEVRFWLAERRCVLLQLLLAHGAAPLEGPDPHGGGRRLRGATSIHPS